MHNASVLFAFYECTVCTLQGGTSLHDSTVSVGISFRLEAYWVERIVAWVALKLHRCLIITNKHQSTIALQHLLCHTSHNSQPITKFTSKHCAASSEHIHTLEQHTLTILWLHTPTPNTKSHNHLIPPRIFTQSSTAGDHGREYLAFTDSPWHFHYHPRRRPPPVPHRPRVALPPLPV
jgi:hypothetical protein